MTQKPSGRGGRAAKAVGKARRTHNDRRVVVIGVVVVLVLALVVVGGVLLAGSSRNGELTAPPGVTGIDAPVQREGGTVIVGHEDAPTTVDVYEDFLCPACRRFEQTYEARMHQAVEGGELRVKYHLLPMLIRLSRPEGYSLDAANAALCAADHHRFWEYHEALFARQPTEGGPGHTEQDLVRLGTALGVTDEGFERCVLTGRHEEAAKAELVQAQNTDFFHGTPTVTVNGNPVDWSERDWLDDALGSSRSTSDRPPGHT